MSTCVPLSVEVVVAVFPGHIGSTRVGSRGRSPPGVAFDSRVSAGVGTTAVVGSHARMCEV